jgi:F0F1-type ATP synthase membrane subunit b/b'
MIPRAVLRISRGGDEREGMSDLDEAPRTYSGALVAVIAVSLLAAIAGLVWCSTLGSRLSTQQTELTDAKQQNVQLAAELRETDARLRVATDELGRSLGLTQKQLDQRAQELVRREQAEEASTKQLATAQQQTAQQVSAVSTDLTSVKTDVGGVKTDVVKTQNDLASAVAQLKSMRGDLTDTQSIIARNHDELVLLEHRGDRNYYEFTLDKGRKKPVGTVSMELRKTDQKRSRFTLYIFADDKTYEKKDRNVNEPLQFYSGKTPQLYEVVVNAIDNKNEISGYLSTPKSAPAPAPTGQ